MKVFNLNHQTLHARGFFLFQLPKPATLLRLPVPIFMILNLEIERKEGDGG
ncbi:MAG: hypothetical protein LUJ25_00520 [Firmicutes bacterium]|nr:hypothetical protein [Bacillota bacterium]